MYTYHSIDRTIERAGLNRKAAIRMIENARIKGREATSFSRPEREYIERKNTEGKRVLIYAGYCFFFNDQNVCITMYSVPVWFGKKHYNGKTEIRNPKRYYRKYMINVEDRAS